MTPVFVQEIADLITPFSSELVMMFLAIVLFKITVQPASISTTKGKEMKTDDDSNTEANSTAKTRDPAIYRAAKLIRDHSKQGNLAGVLEVFNQLKRTGQSHRIVYNTLMNAFVANGNLPVAAEVFEEAFKLGLVDPVSFNILIKGYVAAGDAEATGKLLSRMKATGLRSSEITYNGLLHMRVLEGNRQGVWRVIQDMREANVAPNVVTCSILMKSISHASPNEDIERAVKLVDAISGPVDEVLFGMMLEACIRCKRFDLITQRLSTVPLAAPSCGSLIKAFGQMGDVESIRRTWKNMTLNGVQPTAVTFGCMLEALVMNQCVDEAWQLVETAWNDDKQREMVNTVSYSTILKGFALRKRTDRVLALYQEMRDRHISCNTITYNTILNACAMAGEVHHIPRLVHDMKAATPPVPPDLVTYSTLVKGYCAAGDVTRAFKVFQEMKEDTKFVPDEILYNTLLGGCAKESRLPEALQVLEDMRSTGVPPSNFTLSSMLKLLGRCQRLDQAFALVEDLCKEFRFRPNIQVYTCLMQACFQNRQASRALMLHDKLLKDGCTPDAKTYAVLARGFLRANMVGQAAETVRCAFHLPGHRMQQTRGRPAGMEPAAVQDVLNRLGACTSEASALESDLRKSGLAYS